MDPASLKGCPLILLPAFMASDSWVHRLLQCGPVDAGNVPVGGLSPVRHQELIVTAARIYIGEGYCCCIIGWRPGCEVVAAGHKHGVTIIAGVQRCRIAHV